MNGIATLPDHDVASKLLRPLGNPDRLKILYFLIDGEKSVGEIIDHTDAKQPFVSQNLSTLRRENIVSARREGKKIYYTLSDLVVRAVLQTLAHCYDHSQMRKQA